MARSQYNIVHQKLDIIYVALIHINMIQMSKILPLKNMYDDSEYMVTSYILQYYIKAWTKGI